MQLHVVDRRFGPDWSVREMHTHGVEVCVTGHCARILRRRRSHIDSNRRGIGRWYGFTERAMDRNREAPRGVNDDRGSATSALWCCPYGAGDAVERLIRRTDDASRHHGTPE